MNRSLYSKIVLIMLVMILSLMSVVGAFLMRGVRDYYLNEFFLQMREVFSSDELASDLRSAVGSEDPPGQMEEILRAFFGQLGINSGTRNYYILSGDTGAVITGSDPDSGGTLEITPNILTALTGTEGYASDGTANYMDVALPISGESGDYIVYIRDNKADVQDLSSELFSIIVSALVIGLVISVLLSLLLAKTLVTPIQSLTSAAERVAGGDFSETLDTQARDEIGVLTQTFNDMAGQLEKTMDELTRSERMRREFVANVSHELRTPITSIRSYAETLADSDALPPETEKQFLGVIVNESDRMAKLVQDLLTLSRFDVGSTQFDIEEFNFGKSVEDVYNAMRLEAQKQNHAFTLTVEESLPQIRGDRARIEQIIMNMMSNALKYTKENGRIRITVSGEGDRVWCEVKDNGIGIPEEDLPRVFERFYRVDKARSRESGGTGLGLSIAQEIAMRHDGKMEIFSRLGKGTTIRVELPVEGPKFE